MRKIEYIMGLIKSLLLVRQTKRIVTLWPLVEHTQTKVRLHELNKALFSQGRGGGNVPPLSALVRSARGAGMWESQPKELISLRCKSGSKQLKPTFSRLHTSALYIAWYVGQVAHSCLSQVASAVLTEREHVPKQV